MIRRAYESEKQEVKVLWMECFDDPKPFTDWYFNENFNAESTFVAVEDACVASAMQVKPFTMCVKGRRLPAEAVWGVSTFPKYRGRGFVRGMFEASINSAFGDGCVISVLVPAVSGMYEKFGYTKVYDIDFCKVNIDNFSRCGSRSMEKLIDIYNRNIAEKDIYAERTFDYWEKTAYAFENILNGKVMLGENGYALLYPEEGGFVAAEAFGVKKCEKIKSLPLMARILNVGKAIEIMTEYIADETVINVRDDIIAENNKCFRISNGKAEKWESNVKEIDIAKFTEMFFDLCKGRGEMYINFPLDI